MQNADYVILVDDKDNMLGAGEKMQVHLDGTLHRAFSIFVLNDNSELLLQQRANDKYHSGGLWTNTCCSHPRPNETTIEAAHRRLMEEMGFDCELQPLFSMLYKGSVGNGLIEHEFDHIYIGKYNGPVVINEQEVKSYSFMSLDEVQSRIAETPNLFTLWMRIAFPEFLQKLAALDQ